MWGPQTCLTLRSDGEATGQPLCQTLRFLCESFLMTSRLLIKELVKIDNTILYIKLWHLHLCNQQFKTHGLRSCMWVAWESSLFPLSLTRFSPWHATFCFEICRWPSPSCHGSQRQRPWHCFADKFFLLRYTYLPLRYSSHRQYHHISQ